MAPNLLRGKLFRYGALAAAAAALVLVGVSVATPAKAPRYRTAAVERRHLDLFVNASGTLEPLDAIDIGTEISGRIREVRANPNDRVKAGQVLVVMDTEQLASRLEEADAALDVARARQLEAAATAHEAQSRFARSERLVAVGFVSAQDLDASRAALERARAGLEVARAQVRAAAQQRFEARSTLAKATIRSPIDGVVIARAIEPGQTVAATFQTPSLLKLAKPLDRMTLRVLVNEGDVGEIARGQDVEFTADAFPERTFHARVEELRNTPRSVQAAVMYEAMMTVANPDGSLRPGMTVNARIHTRSLADAITVPNAALRFAPAGRDDGASAPDASPAGLARHGTVWVVRDGVPVSATVQILQSDGLHTAIGAGPLAAGDAVIVEQPDRS